MKRLIILLTFILSPTAALAEGILTGNDVFQACQDNKSQATAYVLGVVDTTTLFQGLLNDNLLCIPEAVNGKQMTDIVCKYLEDVPSIRHKSAAGAVVAALKEPFTCKD